MFPNARFHNSRPAAASARILPGDGDFQLARLVDAVRALGYAGWISLELMNPTVWQLPAVQVAAVGLTAMRRLLGQTTSGS